MIWFFATLLGDFLSVLFAQLQCKITEKKAKNQFLWCHVFNLVMIEVTVFHLFWEGID